MLHIVATGVCFILHVQRWEIELNAQLGHAV